MILPAPAAPELRALRAELGLSAAKMAALAGYSHMQEWQAVESGRSNISAERWTCLMLALDRHPRYRLARRRVTAGTPPPPAQPAQSTPPA